MEKLLEEYKVKIELDLYPQVLANVEVMMEKKEKGARANAIKAIVTLIETFSEDNKLDMNHVKEYLLEIIELDIEVIKKKNQEMYLEEYNKAKKILEEDVR